MRNPDIETNTRIYLMMICALTPMSEVYLLQIIPIEYQDHIITYVIAIFLALSSVAGLLYLGYRQHQELKHWNKRRDKYGKPSGRDLGKTRATIENWHYGNGYVTGPNQIRIRKIDGEKKIVSPFEDTDEIR